jgi:hypothetical protein
MPPLANQTNVRMRQHVRNNQLKQVVSEKAKQVLLHSVDKKPLPSAYFFEVPFLFFPLSRSLVAAGTSRNDIHISIRDCPFSFCFVCIYTKIFRSWRSLFVLPSQLQNVRILSQDKFGSWRLLFRSLKTNQIKIKKKKTQRIT